MLGKSKKVRACSAWCEASPWWVIGLHRVTGWQGLSAQPTKPGLYIHNGRKVVIK